MNNNLPCEDNDCAYYKMDYQDRTYCSKKNRFIDNETGECEYFTPSQTCDLCKHSYMKVYETGSIDDIEYYCKLQNGKLIYDDLSPYMINFADFPKCNINKFEKKD
jgi:hypothetical protein